MDTQILLSACANSPLVSLTPHFEDLGFLVKYSNCFNELRRLVAEKPSFSFIAFDESNRRSESLALLAMVKEFCPQVPTLYIEGRKHRVWSSVHFLPDVLLGPTFDCDQIKVHADYLLRNS
ncbi:MAG: hypothetical protein AB8G05_16270 [Oligoflexales bacterium]